MLFLLALACRPPASPSPEVEVRDALYFVLVDRFARGEPKPGLATAPDDPQGWHGGDLRGLLDRLDYLEGLGVGGVWVSPITASLHDKIDEWGAFHGYWVADHRAMEPRFGTIEDAVALSEGLHSRDMKLYLDMVWNHVGYDAPLTVAHPDWFHGNGDVVRWDDPQEAITHDVHGLPDLAQERPEVAAYLTDASQWWAETVRPDGFRVDAVRHLPSPFLRQIGTDLRASRPGFALLGEHFEGDPWRLAERFHSDGFDAVFDFPMHYAMKDVFCADAHMGRLAATLSADRAYGDRDGSGGLSHLVPFLDNHDVPRIRSACGGDADRVARALAFLVTTRGTPCIFQGTEAGQLGEGEPQNRADMDFGAGHPLADTLRDLLDLRARNRVLREGITRVDHLERERMLYTRVAPGVVARIAVNASERPWTPPAPEGQLVATGSAVVTAAGPLMMSESWEVPPGSIGVMLYAGDTAALSQAVADRRAATTQVHVQARGVPAGPDAVVRLVGAGELLGRWSPDAGRIGTVEGDGYTWTFEAPLDDVLALKLVVQDASGDRWSPGADRYVHVASAEGPQIIRWE